MAQRVEIPFVGPHYTNRERPLSSQISRNMWAEVNPEARNQVAMHNMAGTRVFSTLEGADRGMHDFNNLMYAVNGGSLYSIDADGVNKNLGSIGGKGRCVMANDQSQLIITTGDTPYRYTVAGGVEAITDPDLVKPTCVAYLNSQFLFDQNDGVWGEFVTSSIEPGLSVDALDFANAESHPDDLIRIIAFRQFAWMFGSHSVEPWQNTGTGNPPWARVSSGVQPYGVAGTHAVVTTTEHIYFLDHKRMPRRSNGLNFENIGNPSIGVEFAKYSKIDDCICYEFVQDNQQFVVFTFPTANRSWAFHEQTGSWSQLSHGVDDDRHRASSMLNVYGLNYCADHTNGLIYEYSLDIFSDNGDPIIKERSTATVHGGLFGVPGKRLWFDEVEFIIVGGETEVAGTGLGAQPIDPFVPLTDCSEIWERATLTPDLHVAGMDDAGVWNPDVLVGTGTLSDDRASGIEVPNVDGNYTYFNTNETSESGIYECQSYIYAGPLMYQRIQTSSSDLTIWVGVGGTGTKTYDQEGITGLSTSLQKATLITDTGTAASYQINKITSTGKTSFDGNPLCCKYIVKKDLTATHWAAFQISFTRITSGLSAPTEYGIWTVSPATGVINLYESSGSGFLGETVDRGDWWEFYIQMDEPLITTPVQGTIGEAVLSIFPALSSDGTTQDVTATGSITVGESEYFCRQAVTDAEYPVGYDYTTIGTKRGSSALRNPLSNGYSEWKESEQYISLANHSNTEGGYYIEWRPQYAASEINVDVEILSIDDGLGLLYYDLSEQKLTSTDGTNTATYPLVIEADTKYRIGVVFGDSIMRVGVDGEWGAEVAYDGAFATATQFDILKFPEGANYWRELRGFQTTRLTAFSEITRLMTASGSVLPAPPPADPQTEIVAPFWENTGNWIDLSALSQTTFEGLFGYVVEGADFNAVYAVNQAALVNTTDDGNRLQIQDTIDCDNAYLAITDASGDVVDSMIYAGVPNGNSVQIPTGADYYVVITSDTGNARIRKWDVTSTPISTEGSVSWDSFFGQPFSLGTFFGNITKIIPSEGVSIRFTIPATSSSYKVSLRSLETPSNPGIREGAVNQEVLNFTDGATYTWGLGGGIDGGVNLSGQDIDLIPGETYFFNVRCANPLSSGNYITIQASSLSA